MFEVSSSSSVQRELVPQLVLDWKPSTHQLLIMITLSVVSFMVALDACIIVTSLSVSRLLSQDSRPYSDAI